MNYNHDNSALLCMRILIGTFKGLISSSNFGVDRVMPSRGSTWSATMVGAEGQNLKNLDF